MATSLCQEIPEHGLQLCKHVEFLAKYGGTKSDYEFCMTEFLRLSGTYWGLTALDLMGQLHSVSKDDVLNFIKTCYDEVSGGFGPAEHHDPHILYTLSAVQILAMYDNLNSIDTEKVISFIVSLQQPDGSFYGDKWGEVDVRFSFCAIATLSLLKQLEVIDAEKAVEFILSCQNFDGGFGSKPGSESHAGLVYCCVGSLSIMGQVSRIDGDLLGWWLCERQLKSGGFNGRPEKLPDVCYSWWVLASLSILGRSHWIDKPSLTSFILSCQDTATGGFADRPGDVVDPFHTLFGLAGLSILGYVNLKPINPVYCMTQEVVDRIGVKVQILDPTSKP